LPRNDPGPDRFFGGGPPDMEFPRGQVESMVKRVKTFVGSQTNTYYLAVWEERGTVPTCSPGAPKDVPMPADNQTVSRSDSFRSPDGGGFGRPPAPGPLRAARTRTRGEYRELYREMPEGTLLLIGRSLKPEVAGQHRLALGLLAAGLGILVLGLAGGWWVAARAIRPIADISAAAAKISAGDLSRRISTTDTDSELGRLAGVLNSTFARLETAFAQQRQFTSDAAHELRTPVSVMLTQTQVTLNRSRTATEYCATVEACHRSAQRMRRLIESLLELARLDAGQEPMKRLPFNLSQMAGDCVEQIRPLAAERGIKIHCDLPPVEVRGDAERLAQVVTNLLANAVQYNQANGEVRVGVKARGGTVLLMVGDTGPGISAKDRPHVFERFYRVDQSRSSGQTGLGLAIARAIVEAHDGTIEISSPPEGGTTFTVVLPA